MSPDFPVLSVCYHINIPSGNNGLRFGEIIGLKAGEELEERLCPRDPLIDFRILEAGFTADVVPVVSFGSKDEGIAINEGLPTEAPETVGAKVGVELADFMVAGEVSVLLFGSKVTMLSGRVPGWNCSACCRCIFRNDEGVAGATSAADDEPVRF